MSKVDNVAVIKRIAMVFQKAGISSMTLETLLNVGREIVTASYSF